MPALLAALLLLPLPARAGTSLAGMGGVGVGVRDGSAELADNPAASTAALGPGEGAVHLGAGWTRLTFAGRAYHPSRTTVSAFSAISPVEWSVATPRRGADRLVLGVWEIEHRGLELAEPLDLAQPAVAGGAALAAAYESGTTSLSSDEALHGAGVVWVRALGGGSAQLALGGGWVSGLARGRAEVDARRLTDGLTERLLKTEARRSLGGPTVVAGVLYRPVPEGSLGLRATHVGELQGKVWEQAAGEPLREDRITRPAQARVGLGGAVTFWEDLTFAADLEYLAESRSSATLFRGTPAERLDVQLAEVAIQTRVGVEFPLKLARGTVPVRAGFFIRQDPLPAAVPRAAAAAVGSIRPASFKQDQTGWTLGSGWSAGGLRADLALSWLLVTTHVRQPGAGGAVQDLGDTRNSFGAVASVTLPLGPRPEDRMVE